MCGIEMQKTNNSQKYCKSCAVIARKDRIKEYKKRERERNKSNCAVCGKVIYKSRKNQTMCRPCALKSRHAKKEKTVVVDEVARELLKKIGKPRSAIERCY